MVWLFERAQTPAQEREVIRMETRYDRTTNEFMLVTTVHGEETTERFATEAAFRKRLQSVETQLEADGWTQSATILLRDGWKVG